MVRLEMVRRFPLVFPFAFTLSAMYYTHNNHIARQDSDSLVREKDVEGKRKKIVCVYVYCVSLTIPCSVCVSGVCRW